MQGEITISGASIGKVIDLTGDLVLTGGNLVNPQITTNGFAFTATSVLRAPVINESRNPADWPDNVTINGALHLAWERLEPYPLAVDIRTTTNNRSGIEGEAIWDKALDEIFADPSITYPTLVANVEAWAETDPGGDDAVTSTINMDRAFRRLQKKFFPGQTFNVIKTGILSKSRETWNGDDTEITEAYG